ncbi:MAG TPA: radical SAM protein [Candidatus Bathyarchaeia archaeon]|nr:radical SAM protein [Candidatus Bathyarchaeia archaeon]
MEQKVADKNAEIKAFLIAQGGVDIDEGVLGRITTPASGPGAGLTSFFLRFDGHRVRLGIKHGSPLKASLEGDEVVIRDHEKEIVRGYLEDAIAHCPKQAYITVSEVCIFDCKYCPVPLLGGSVKSQGDVEAAIDQILADPKLASELRAIALTSGIEESAQREVERIAAIVRALRKKYDLPIGVSVYPTQSSTKILKDAGADEIKYNVETMDRELFQRMCPGLSLEFVLQALREAVQVFGRNKVFSNLIVGLGEDDESIVNGLEELTSMGVIPMLRAAVEHPLRSQAGIRRPDPEKLLTLARKERELLDKYGLRADVAQTMCAPCTGCDLVPHRDV